LDAASYVQSVSIELPGADIRWRLYGDRCRSLCLLRYCSTRVAVGVVLPVREYPAFWHSIAVVVVN
jgi:hypothetical protein